jgi:DNA repair exonuclease SbcCD ATPase subunit
MKITFKTLRFRNFLSYGNNITEINFNNPGLISLSGKNGVGKSVIEDALGYVLYGKPYRKIKIKELVNRANKKDLWVELIFYQNQQKYRLTRTLAPASIKIEKWINAINEFEELELLSSTKLIQEEINKIIGIEYDTFKHIVAIATSAAQTKPFLTMPVWEKRSLIESLFNLEIISDMLRAVKSDKSANKHKLSSAESNKQLLQSMVTQTKNQLDSSRLAVKNFDENKNKTIKDYEMHIDRSNTEIDKHIETLKILKNVVKPDLIKKLKDKKAEHRKIIDELISKKGEHTGTIKHSENMIKSLNETDICPVCNTNVTEEHKEKEIKIFSDKKTTSSESIITIDEEVKSHKEKIKTIEANLDDLNIATHKIKSTMNNVESLKKNVANYMELIVKKRDEKIEVDLDEINQLLEENRKNLEDTVNIVNDCVKQESIIDIAMFLLSDSGIKTEFYNVVVPLFNATINDYIQKFELPVVIVFDYEFNVTINTVQSKDEDVNYYSFSDGEKRRIEIAILLSFIKLSKAIANWNCNLLIMDEILDSGIDSEGLKMMLESIRDIATNEQMSIYVVSHKVLDEEVFDRKMLITKDAIFSKILEI